MGNIIDGKALSLAVKDEVKAEVPVLEARYGRRPCLVVIIVGENPASQVYVRNKVKAAAYTGMESQLIELPADISEEALLGKIVDLNNDPKVDGILVQLPLPKHIDEEKVIDTIAREKDVDGFHPGNVAGLWLGKDCIVPCTPAGVMRMIDSIGLDLKGKNAVVVGRSNIVGKPSGGCGQGRSGDRRDDQARRRGHRRGNEPQCRGKALRRRGLRIGPSCGRLDYSRPRRRGAYDHSDAYEKHHRVLPLP